MFEYWLNEDPEFVQFMYRVYLSEKRKRPINDNDVFTLAKKLNMRIKDIEYVMNYRL
jgi:hypothetical protein